MTTDSNPAPVNPKSDKPKKKSHRDWSGATLGLAIGVLGLIMARLGHLWVGFDVFSQFFMQFFLLALAMVLALAFPRLKGLAGATLFVALIVAYALWPQIQFDKAEAALPPGTSRLKVASFNSYFFNQHPEKIADAIIALDPDVITLVEFSDHNQPILNVLRTNYPFQENCFAVLDCDAAILSKYPLFNASSKGTWVGAPIIQASLGPQFGNLTIVGIHTTRFPHSRAQFTQIRQVIKYLETIPSRIVFMGDFNATPFSRITQTVVDGLGVNRLTNKPTWPATFGFPQLAIDHIFASADIVPLTSEVIGNNGGSDHFPVAITLAVPQN